MWQVGGRLANMTIGMPCEVIFTRNLLSHREQEKGEELESEGLLGLEFAEENVFMVEVTFAARVTVYQAVA